MRGSKLDEIRYAQASPNDSKYRPGPVKLEGWSFYLLRAAAIARARRIFFRRL